MRLFVAFLGLFIISIGIYALPDTLKISSDTESSITVGADYASNSSTFGHLNSFVKQPIFSPYVSYFGKKGLFGSSIFNFVGNSDSTNTKTTSEIDLQLGYQWNISEQFSISPSFTHFVYSSHSTSFKSGITDYLQLDFYTELKWWFASVSAGYIFGDSNEPLILPQTGANIEIEHFLGKNNTLAFQPSVSINVGSQKYFNIYYSDKYLFLKPYTNNNPNATVGDFLNDYDKGFTNFDKKTKTYFNLVLANHPRYLERLQQLPQNEQLTSLTEISDSNNKFTITSVALTLPIYYYVGNIAFNFTFSAYKPVNQSKYLNTNWVTYISAGLSCTFGDNI